MGKKRRSKRDRSLKVEKKGFDLSLNPKVRTEILLLGVSFAYIAYFVNLDFFYDWDATYLAIMLRDGLEVAAITPTHFLVPILVGIVATIFEPIISLKIIAGLFMMIFVLSIFRFAYYETKDLKIGSLASLFILLNFGFTFNLTSLEDNIVMYAFLTPFILFLLREEWKLSALFLSLSILVHMQSLVFVPIFIIYALFKSGLHPLMQGPRGALDKIKILAYEKRETIGVTLTYFSVPIISAYFILLLGSARSTGDIIRSFLGYHGNPNWWYFASDRGLYEQFELAYSGMISTFVFRSPEFQDRMPQAPYIGLFFFLLLAYILLRGTAWNHKTLCAVPTFIVLFSHSIFYESWSIERWDFLPFFIVYFVIVGYSTKGIRTKSILKIALSLAVILSAIFTYNCFYTISQFRASPGYQYADELSLLLYDETIALESIHPNSELGLYLRYRGGDRVIFLTNEYVDVDLSKATWVYASAMTYRIVAGTAQEPKDVIWKNPVNEEFNIVRFKIK